MDAEMDIKKAKYSVHAVVKKIKSLLLRHHII
jgi:hypothetical protein